MDELKFEFLFAIIAFASTRYALPNKIMNKPIVFKEIIVLSLCYGLCSILRKKASQMNNEHNKITN